MTLQIHSHTIQREGFVLGNSSCLKIQRFERNLLHHLTPFIVVYLLQLGKFFTADFLHLGISFLGKGGAGGAGVSRFSTAEAEFLLDATFAFFWGELGDLDGVDDHGIRVMDFRGQGVGKGVVRLVGSLGVLSGNVVSSLPLDLESSGLFVPVVDGGRDGVHRHDSTHQCRWDSCREISN